VLPHEVLQLPVPLMRRSKKTAKAVRAGDPLEHLRVGVALAFTRIFFAILLIFGEDPFTKTPFWLLILLVVFAYLEASRD
jgi:hypothetical protein